MNKNTSKQEPENPEISAAEKLVMNTLNSGFIKKNGKNILWGVLIAVLIVAAVISQSRNWKAKGQERNKELGPAYVFFTENKMDSAEVFLKDFLAVSRSSLVESKALLLLARSQYAQRKYAEALASFSKIGANPSSRGLIASGALYGQAACQMQLENYSEAASVLEQFISKFMNKGPGKALHNLDEVPSVPGALWKLALCYQQLNKPDKARETCSRLVQLYKTTEEGEKAARLLPSL